MATELLPSGEQIAVDGTPFSRLYVTHALQEVQLQYWLRVEEVRRGVNPPWDISETDLSAYLSAVGVGRFVVDRLIDASWWGAPRSWALAGMQTEPIPGLETLPEGALWYRRLLEGAVVDSRDAGSRKLQNGIWWTDKAYLDVLVRKLSRMTTEETGWSLPTSRLWVLEVGNMVGVEGISHLGTVVERPYEGTMWLNSGGEHDPADVTPGMERLRLWLDRFVPLCETEGTFTLIAALRRYDFLFSEPVDEVVTVLAAELFPPEQLLRIFRGFEASLGTTVDGREVVHPLDLVHLYLDVERCGSASVFVPDQRPRVSARIDSCFLGLIWSKTQVRSVVALLETGCAAEVLEIWLPVVLRMWMRTGDTSGYGLRQLMDSSLTVELPRLAYGCVSHFIEEGMDPESALEWLGSG